MNPLTDEILHALVAARNNDLWQEEDGSSREYNHEYFGYSDYVRDLTEAANAAAEAGLIELMGAWRRWAPTGAGEVALAQVSGR